MQTHEATQREQQEPEAWPKVAIIVLNWNGWQDTIECLESLQGLIYPDYQVIVVDNGSKDDSVEKIKAWASENLGKGHFVVEYTQGDALEGGKEAREDALGIVPSKVKMVLIRNEENLGFTGGNNVAIYYALHKKYPANYVFLVNNDAKVDTHCLTNLVEVDRKAKAGIVGAVVMGKMDGQIQFAGEVSLLRLFFAPLGQSPIDLLRTTDEFWTSCRASGAAMLISKEVLNTVHHHRGQYLNESLFMYYDELEFCFIASLHGHRPVVAKEAVVYHGFAGSTGGKYNPTAYYYSTRNRVLVANMLLPYHWRVLFHPTNLSLDFGRVLKTVLHRRPDAAKAIISGLIDGYRRTTGQWKHHNRMVLKYKV